MSTARNVERDDVESRFSALALGGATGTFALIGAVSSLYGPLLVTLSQHYSLSLPRAGEVLSVHFVGALFGVLGAWIGIRLTNGRHVLHGALALLTLGSLAVLVAHQWDQLLIAILFVGLGFGALDFSLNTLLSRTAEEGRARRLSIPNAGYGVGAVIGPLLVLAVNPAHFPTIFLIIASSGIVLVTFTMGVSAPRLRSIAHHRHDPQLAARRRWILGTFVLAYILYVAVETSSSGWLATQLRHEGYSPTVASLATSAFWAGLAVGRSLGGVLHGHLGTRWLVLSGLGMTVLLALSAVSVPIAPWAYSLTGLVLASVFPMGLLWYGELLPQDVDGIALMILMMMLGGVVGPGAVGLMVSLVGIHVVPLVVAAFAALDFAVFLYATRFSPPHTVEVPAVVTS